jgi:hypothetical protein
VDLPMVDPVERFNSIVQKIKDNGRPIHIKGGLYFFYRIPCIYRADTINNQQAVTGMGKNGHLYQGFI